jgi:hypothetical protein
MNQRRLPLLLGVLGALMASACGGSTPPSASFNSAFAKTWNGGATILLPDVGSTPNAPGWTGQVVVTVSGASASVSGLCWDGTGAITLTGSGNSGTWTGSMSCPGFLSYCGPGNNTGQLITTLTSATVTLQSTGGPLGLSIQGAGTATCGGVSTTFDLFWGGN